MDELQQLREEIDQIDRQMVELFRQRMAVTGQVGQYKLAHGLPVLDAARERQVLQDKARLVDGDLRPGVTTLFQTIMSISRRQQRDMTREGADNPGLPRFVQALSGVRTPVEHPRVVFQGVAGAYSEQACVNFFGEEVDATGLPQFEDAFVALKEGRADYAVLPIENSSTGAIRQIYDLLTQYDFFLVGETTVKVDHCLMALPGATLDTITHVYSHEQGLMQSAKFLSRHPQWRQVPQWDTAGSAKLVAERGDVTCAALCSARAAKLYGLNILACPTNDNPHNTTRFVVVSPRMELREGADKISTVFLLPHRAGSLHEILTIFAVHGLNMVKLESRPLPEHSWEYMFFLEFTGSLNTPEIADVLHELSQTTGDFRVLGNFVSNLEE
ncbi:MAG TPA: chorismate mutase [Candidatus Enterenecus avicola]|nr:chorismate mutase [Candidatus Enterenecus avicola]